MESIKMKTKDKDLKPKKSRQPIKRDQKRFPLLDLKAGQLIAITGGIGTGKTFVLRCLERLGFIVFDADKMIHAMLEAEGSAYREVGMLFPQAQTPQRIDRKIMGDIVLKDAEKLKKLEAILHPKLRAAQMDLMLTAKRKGGTSIIFEVPLLFENKREKHYDLIIVTSTDLQTQKNRVLQRNNMTEEKFDAIIKRQVAEKVRLKGAHFVIKTNLSEQDTKRQVRAIVKDVISKRNSPRHRDNRPLRKKRG